MLLQVLSILDGTAITWPGVATALSDMDTLVSLGGRNMLQLDQQCRALQLQLGTTQEKAATLDSSLAGETPQQHAWIVLGTIAGYTPAAGMAACVGCRVGTSLSHKCWQQLCTISQPGPCLHAALSAAVYLTSFL
jgi:hypothetical protein